MSAAELLAYVESAHPHRLNDRTREIIAVLVADDGRDSGEVLSAAGIYPGTARYWLRKKGLPCARDWRRLGRGLRIAGYLAAHPTATEVEAALALGYTDRTALYHATSRAFGLPLGRARNQSPERLVACWLHRHPSTFRRGV